jgi:ubiquinone/menaquinone biosynthesis C-methylase UbiE
MQKNPINFSIANANLTKKKILQLSKNYLIRFKKNNINYSTLAKNKKVLIAGSGPGREIILFDKFNPDEVYAVDLSLRNVKLGKSIIKKYSLDSRKNFVKKANIEKLPFQNGFFDHVFSYGVIHHAKNTDKCFVELNRVLKQNGTMMLFLYGSSGIYFYLIRKFRKIVKDLSIKEIFKFSKEIKSIDPMLVYHFLDDWKAEFLRTYSHSDLIARASQLGLRVEKFLNRGLQYDIIERIRISKKEAKLMGEGELRYIFKKTNKINNLNKNKLPNNKIGSVDRYDAKILTIYEKKFGLLEKTINNKSKKKKFMFCHDMHKELLKIMRQNNEFNHKKLINIIEKYTYTKIKV